MDLGVHEEEEGVKVAPPSASASVAEEQQGGKGGEDDGFGGSAGGGEGGALALPSASGVEEGIPVEDEASSCCSSPLRKPYIPRVVIGHNAMGREIYKPIGGEDFRALDPWEAKYQAKRGLYSFNFILVKRNENKLPARFWGKKRRAIYPY